MNKSMVTFARNEIIRGLGSLPNKCIDIFKRGYSPHNKEKDITQIVNELPEENLSRVLTQVENTVRKYKKEGE
jgi:hypothetical protein